MAKKSENKGYCIYIASYATSENRLYKAGTLDATYAGARGTILGTSNFKPYKTESAALRGKPAWERLFRNPRKGWKTHIGGVFPVTDELIKKAQDELVQDMTTIAEILGMD